MTLEHETYLDSRDVESRIEELEAERDEFLFTDPTEEALVEAANGGDEAASAALEDYRLEREDSAAFKLLQASWEDSESGLELNALVSLRGEVENNSSEWSHGLTLIREEVFVDHIREQEEEDNEALDSLEWWISQAIDWDKVAETLKGDYKSVKFQGETYYYLG